MSRRRTRPKLAQHLSYPIGAKEIKESLGGVLNAEKLSVRFVRDAVYPGREWRKVLANRLPYMIAQVSYHPLLPPSYSTPNQPFMEGWFDQQWELRVYPVLRELRSVANELLVSNGLPAVKTWFEQSDANGWDLLKHSLQLIFDPEKSTLSRVQTDFIS